MAFILLFLVLATVATTVWFFVARSPERASGHSGSTGPRENYPERSHFAPGDAATEDDG